MSRHSFVLVLLESGGREAISNLLRLTDYKELLYIVQYKVGVTCRVISAQKHINDFALDNMTLHWISSI